ncbi:ZNF93-like protein [Mya arenaria]|uniref:ZNF93-like protein n=1 Tax=Mya arenaria TaxID=6604 RepID=A0ABY7E6M4_MYAAR|nr:zinc finger protein 471-like [Mya arenaria]WAR04809.1 ZNF93-like protein [Mya arenaria]
MEEVQKNGETTNKPQLSHKDISRDRKQNKNTENSVSCLCEGDSGSKLLFRCGTCKRKFKTLCFLHKHLMSHLRSTGSYHYDDVLKTAFPKYESCCSSTQTEMFFENLKREFPDDDIISSQTNDVKDSALDQVDMDVESDDSFANSGDCFESVYSDVVKVDRISKKGLQNSLSNKKAPDHLNGSKQVLEACDEDSCSTLIIEPVTLNKRDVNVHVNTARTKGNKTIANGSHNSPKRLISKNKFICDQCKVMFRNKKELLKHESKTHSNELKFNCDKCKDAFIRVVDYKKHKSRAHSPAKNIQKDKRAPSGPVDDIEVKNEKSVIIKREETPGTKSKIRKRKCEGAKIKKPKESGQQEGNNPHTCELCGYVMPRSKVAVHMRLHSGDRPYKCEQCGKGLISSSKLQRHMLIHDEKKKHACDICGAGFTMKYKLRMHMHIHTGKKPYLCSICGAEFNHSANLATHTRCVHLQVKPFHCEICGGSYAKRSQLDEHVLSHSSEKHHTCRYCGKSFKYLKGLRRHEKNHSDDAGSLKCDDCGTKFTRKDTLDRHRLIHSKETMLHCPTCQITFENNDEFKEHIDSHVEKIQYECILCKQKFKVPGKYYTHMLAIHNISKELARQVHSDVKDGQFSQKVAELIAKAASPADPNLPLHSEDNVSFTSKSSSVPCYNVNQVVSNIIEENKASLNALTRAATENLRLHSQDVREEEKNIPLVPPINPLVLFEKSNNLLPLDHYGIDGKSQGQRAHPMNITDHNYGQSLNSLDQSIHTVHSGMQHSDLNVGHLQSLNLPDNFSLGPHNSLTCHGVGHPFMARNMVNFEQVSDQHSVEQGAIESLRRLQESSNPPLSVAMATSSGMMSVSQGQGHIQSAQVADNSSATNYRLQNLF